MCPCVFSVRGVGPGRGGHPLPLDDGHPVFVAVASPAGLLLSAAAHCDQQHASAPVPATGRYMTSFNSQKNHKFPQYLL